MGVRPEKRKICRAINQYAEDKNLIKFMISDLDERIIISKPYKVVIRKE